MLIKSVKYKGNNLNCLKFKRVISKKGILKIDNTHVIITNVELMRIYERLHVKFGSHEQFMAVKVPKKKVLPKPIKKKPETIALFGMVDTEIEV